MRAVVVAFVTLVALAVVATVMGRLSNRADAEIAIETDPAGRSESESAQPNATQLVDADWYESMTPSGWSRMAVSVEAEPRLHFASPTPRGDASRI